MSVDPKRTQSVTPSSNPVKAARLRRNIGQERLAALSGLSRSWVGFLERNPEAMTPTAAEKLAAVLKIDPRELMP